MQAKAIEWKLRNAIRSNSRWIVIHSSLFHLRIQPEKLSTFKWQFLKAVRALTEDGYQIAFPSFTFSFTKTGVFHENLPSEVGVLSDWVLDLQDAKRTTHPIYSHVLIGNNIEGIFSSSIKTCFGDDGIYAFFEERNATIMMLGCDWSYCTPFHRFEEKFNVPYRYHKTFMSFDKTISTSMFVRDEKLTVKNDFSLWIQEANNERKIHRIEFYDGLLQSIDLDSMATLCCNALESDKFVYTKVPEILKYEVSCRDAMNSSDKLKIAILYESNYEPLVAAMADAFVRLMPHVGVSVYANDYGQMASDILTEKLNNVKPDFCFLPSRLEDILQTSNLELTDLSLESALDSYISLIKRVSAKVSRLVFINLFPVSVSSVSTGAIEQGGNHVTQRIGKFNQYLIDNVSDLNNVRLLPAESLKLEYFYDSRLWFLGRISYSPDGFCSLAENYSGLLAHELGFSTRLIILDLDNTLWGGVLGEEGVDGIHLGGDFPGNIFKSFQQTISKLYDRGIALAIVSKNDEDLALQAMAEHIEMVIKDNYISSYRINWSEKALNIRSIAEEIGLSLRNVMFVDDNPLEREKVRRMLPEVNVIELPDDPAGYSTALLSSPFLKAASITSEDKRRAKFYVKQRRAKLDAVEFQNLDDYFQSLDIQVTIAAVNKSSFSRAIQLTNKTNQFNTTTRRFSEKELQQLMLDEDYRVLTIGYQDNAIDPEIIGLCVLNFKQATCVIELFLMSCRVLGRSIESAVLAFVENYCKTKHIDILQGEIVITERNTPVREIYKNHGFMEDRENVWIKDIRKDADMEISLKVPRWIKVNIVQND